MNMYIFDVSIYPSLSSYSSILNYQNIHSLLVNLTNLSTLFFFLFLVSFCLKIVIPFFQQFFLLQLLFDTL